MPAPHNAAARERLETAAATAVGRLIFAFTRLDANLGLCVAWANGGRKVDALTKRFNESTYHAKLVFLEGPLKEMPRRRRVPPTSTGSSGRTRRAS